jgi:hypothetical protein
MHTKTRKEGSVVVMPHFVYIMDDRRPEHTVVLNNVREAGELVLFTTFLLL